MDEETTPHRNHDAGEDFADIETPDELKPHTVPQSEPVAHVEFPPSLDRVRPERPPLVPRWVWITAAAIAAVIVIGAGLGVWLALSGRVDVPDVVGLDVNVAQERLNSVGLQTTTIEERFSSKPKGTVLEQRPVPGERLKKGESVGLILSAGTEEFVMPDVIGDGLTLARGTLEARGLIVEVEAVTSDQASDTVISTTPAPGVLVRIGDRVRVQVASPRPESTSLRPYLLQGVAVTIDPGLSPRENSDITLDVARRLRALLEASGATVITLRSSTGTATTDADRAAAARESSATLAVGLSVNETGPAGRLVVAPLVAGAPSPIQLRDKIASQLATVAPPAKASTVTSDAVLGALTVPWARVTLGAYSSRTDETAFSDPRWADQIARAIYVGIGEVFGTKEGL